MAIVIVTGSCGESSKSTEATARPSTIAPRAPVVLHALDAAELSTRGGASVRARHAATLVFARQLVEMRLDFGVQIAFPPCDTQRAEEPQ